MKVVIDHQIFSSQEYGGISRYFVELANHISDVTNVTPVVLAPLNFNRHFNDLEPSITRGKYIKGLPKTGKVTRMLNKCISRFWLKRINPEIVHATYFYATRGAYNENAKIVITVHDMIHELFPENFPRSDHTAQLIRAAVTMADHVICVTANTRNDLIRLTGVDPGKVSVVHHGIRQICQGLAADQRIPESPYLLYVGQRSGYKNYSGLLTAYANSAELNKNFRLICFGGNRFSKKEREKHIELGLADGQVHWLAGSDSLLAGLYTHATAFVYPSLYEGFGIPPLEAMSFDCPVICSNQGAIPEVVGHAGEYFDPYNPDGISNSIKNVTGNPAYADELRQRGHIQARKFSWQNCALQTCEIYQSLL